MTHSSEPLISVSTAKEKRIAEEAVVFEARCRLSRNGHFRCRSDSISIDFHEGRLVLMGRLPSFYLKQVLQSVLRGLPGVQRIENHVDVVSSIGLSSVESFSSGGKPL